MDTQGFDALLARLGNIEGELAGLKGGPAGLPANIAELVSTGVVRELQKPRRSVLSEHMLCLASEDLATKRNDIQGKESFKHLQKTQMWDDFRQLSMTTSDTTAGGAMVQETLSMDLIEVLRASSAVSRLNPQSVQMPTGGVTTIKLTTGAVAYYVGEGKPPTVTKVGTGRVNLVFRKLMVFVPISNDLIRYALAGSVDAIRRDTVNAARTRGDLAFIRGTGLSDTPTGLRYLAAAANIVSSAGTSQANITSDVALAHGAMAAANVPMTMVGTIMAPRSFYYIQSLITANGVKCFPSMSEGSPSSPTRDGLPKLEGDPVTYTSQMPIDISSAITGYTGSAKTDIIIADFDQIMLGESLSMRIDVSQDGGYTDAAGAQQNAFANDETLLRLTMEHDINVKYPEAIYVIKDVAY
jgi:HK97 family phage major capsid protein